MGYYGHRVVGFYDKHCANLALVAEEGADVACDDQNLSQNQPLRSHVNSELRPFKRCGSVDNLSSHKGGIIDAIETAGAAVRYLHPYSPDLNPISRPSASSKATR
jgi:hypothetical protein